jgi:uncharacterized glyoxalase superfamily protein PhnB
MPSKAKPVPDGYHTITPYLNIANAGRAVEFMKKAFGAEESYRMNTPDGRVAHAEMRIGDSLVMVGEAIEMPSQPGSLMLYVDDVDALFKRATAAGAMVRQPPTDMFYGDRSCRLTDPCGNNWAIATHIEDVPPAELETRAAEWMKQKK